MFHQNVNELSIFMAIARLCKAICRFFTAVQKSSSSYRLTSPPLDLPVDEGFRKLLGNPMMLTLYALTGGGYGHPQNDERLQFKHPVSSAGELLWNFTEAQLAKQMDACEKEEQKAWCDFLVHLLLPRLAFEMEK
ncbi:MAG: hypothetical protein AAB316_00095, partial [Bacteroidota bacterium]